MSTISAKSPIRSAVPVFVATTAMLSFISFWRAAAIVLSDLASSAYYVGGDTEKVIGKSAAWFVLAVMLFSYAVRAVYIESSAMFVRGGVYRVVKEAMGGMLAKLSVSALLFDYVLTGPISAVSAGLYMAGFVQDLSVHLGHAISLPANAFAAGFALLVTAYFWWKNVQGIHESSTKALWIMGITTVMVVILIVWCLVTLGRVGVHLPPSPLPANMKLNQDFFGWLGGIGLSGLSGLTGVILLAGFGHSVLAMSGEESLAQVNREIASPKLQNLQRAGLVIFLYSLFFTSLVSFFAVMIIPDAVRPAYFGNLISGLAMYVVGPPLLKLVFQGFVVLVGVLILSGAVNTAIVGSNGVLNRVSEDGVMPAWFRRPHRHYGTSYRLINLITGLQMLTIVLCRGNVFALAGLYAFGVIWSFAFKGLAVLVLRYKNRNPREWKVPGNLQVAGREVPLGLAFITLVLFLTAVVNLFTKPEATMAGVAFSLVFFGIFTVSERLTARRESGLHLEQFRVYSSPEVDDRILDVRPGSVLVGVRDPRNLSYLGRVLADTDTGERDVVVMTARLYHREHSFAGNRTLEARDIFDQYEQELFTAVVAVAEREGKTVSLLVAAGSDVFDTLMLTARSLRSTRIVCGLSNKLSPDEQGKLTGDAWERLPEPRPAITLELVGNGGVVFRYVLGPHAPRLRNRDLVRLHQLWLQLSADPEFHALHHYHVVSLALEELQHELDGRRRQELLRRLRDEMEDRDESQ